MLLAACIVNYRTPAMTVDTVVSLLHELESTHEITEFCIFVVDNASGDGSVERLRVAAAAHGWGQRVAVLESQTNGGYGYGINVAVEHALAQVRPPDVVYVLNSDAVPDVGGIARLLTFLRDNAEFGVAGGNVHDADGTTQGARFRFPTIWSELERGAELGLVSRLLRKHIVALPPAQHSTEADWIPGTFMLIRREVFEDAGLFDEGFFLYFEEIDFCRRARRAGWKTAFVANAGVSHRGSASTGLADISRRLPAYWFHSRHRYFLKHHGRLYTAVTDAAFAASSMLGRLKGMILRRPRHTHKHVLVDFVIHGVRRIICTQKLSPSTVAHGSKPVGPEHFDPTGAHNDRRRPEHMPLSELVWEDIDTYERKFTEPGLWAVIVHRLHVRSGAVRIATLRTPLETASKLLATAVDWIWGIHIPCSVRLGRRVRLWHSGAMLLAARSIGDDVHIRHATTLGPERSDGLARSSQARPVIEDAVDIGSGACILGQVTVGRGAVVGANSVVLKDVPARAKVLGVPARIVPL